MATVRQRPNGELEERLRDLRLATWVTPAEQAEIRRIIGGRWTPEGADRLEELRAHNCAWWMQGKVPGETAGQDATRAMVGMAYARHTAALRDYAAQARLSLREAADSLGVRQETWGGFAARCRS